jgi:hypothetical protein
MEPTPKIKAGPHSEESEEGWQDDLQMEGGTHPSWEKYSKELNEFMDNLKSSGVKTFTFGFAWEHDESHCRHVHVEMDNGEEIYPGNSGFPAFMGNWDYDQKMYDLFDSALCSDWDKMHRVRVNKRIVDSGEELYITEPRLIDNDGGEPAWNV